MSFGADLSMWFDMLFAATHSISQKEIKGSVRNFLFHTPSHPLPLCLRYYRKRTIVILQPGDEITMPLEKSCRLAYALALALNRRAA